jgi:hypothetical protein
MEVCEMRRIVLMTAVALFLLTGTALADYQAGQDSTLSLTALPQLVQTSSATGSITFAAQEQVHSTITGLTGQSIDHSYVWVAVNGQKVLAVDPVCVYNIR